MDSARYLPSGTRPLESLPAPLAEEAAMWAAEAQKIREEAWTMVGASGAHHGRS